MALAQRRLNGGYPGDEVLTRACFAAFIVQGFVLIGLALSLRAVDVPAEAKAVLVAVGGLAGSYLVAWVLVHLPGVRQVL